MDAWKPDYIRGYINNMFVNLTVDFYSMSDRMLRDYARMIRSFGYTGVQMTDACTHWRWFDSYEPDHDRKIEFCKACHAEGLKTSLWVWAANFRGNGWSDPDVVYEAKDGGSAYDDPDVFACFSRYYDIYAELAPYYDRLILHFFDPGHLSRYDDIFRFCRLIEDKFRAKNPDIRMGVDTWGCPSDFPTKLVEAGFGDYMLMELPFLPNWGRPGRREEFRRGVKALGCELGVWSWYTADIEVDQSARWIVNPRVIKDVYTRVREQGDHVMVPSYWSEMDSYHILNLFSLYCAGRLLIDPERDPEELLSEIAHKIYGDRYGDKVLYVLRFAEDARAGDKWETYWWNNPHEPGVVIDDFAAMAERAEKAFEYISEVAADRDLTTSQPLPVTPAKLAMLMQAHIDQLRRYMRFRADFEELEKLRESGAGADVLTAELKRIWKPVPDFNCLVGVWGQPERRVQLYMVWDFCRRTGLEMPLGGITLYTLKKHYYEYLCNRCKVYETDTVGRKYYEGGLPYGFLNDRILSELEADGLITLLEDGKVRLNDSETYTRYR
jgi:hypothetical protein